MIAECESFADMAAPPECWEDAMRALVAGVVDSDDAMSLAKTCAEIAGPLWSKQIKARVAALHEAHRVAGEVPTDLAAWFTRMGSKVDLSLPTQPTATKAEQDANANQLAAEMLKAVEDSLNDDDDLYGTFIDPDLED